MAKNTNAVKLTDLEIRAIKLLWESSYANGHDFGVTDELPGIALASRGGVVASLEKKGIIDVHEAIRVNRTAKTIAQFTFTTSGKGMFINFDTEPTLVSASKPVASKPAKTVKASKPEVVKPEVVKPVAPVATSTVAADVDAPTYPGKTSKFIWSVSRVALVKAMRALGATSPTNARSKKEIAVKACIHPDRVGHWLYKDNDLVTSGYVGIAKGIEGIKGSAYYLTRKGATCKLPS